MSDHVVYVDRFKVAEGKLEDLKSYASEMSEAVANKVPGVLSFNYFIDERGRTAPPSSSSRMPTLSTRTSR